MATTIARYADTSIGPKFLAISNSDLHLATVNALRPFGDTSIHFTPGRNTDSQLLLTATLNDLTFDLPEAGGKFTPRLWLLNDNRGGKAFQVGLGLFRFVCLNGLYFGLSEFTRKLNHVDGPNAHGVLDILSDMLAAGVENILHGSLEERIGEALAAPVQDPVGVIGSLGIPKRVKDRAIETILLEHTREEDSPRNAWGVYNIVNESYRLVGRSPLRKALTDMMLLQDIEALAAHQIGEAA
jgi:hypothetical protein